ncbi:hypothetical protein SAMN05518684_10827 [Salipaludibacillus aurantiacus]|uniref:Uncharacterized protein n=1 Tax=Salipaludibacillus aurantiacus TaxID=1601833 RepID=A0A1H9ULP6_9BACI|nr:hypothetical protein SAMN05518684_10827 [Salipaludibacillus aurantiacus]
MYYIYKHPAEKVRNNTERKIHSIHTRNKHNTRSMNDNEKSVVLP